MTLAGANRWADWRHIARATYVEDDAGLHQDYDANLSRAFGVASGAPAQRMPAWLGQGAMEAATESQAPPPGL